jgi:hypothetical protein
LREKQTMKERERGVIRRLRGRYQVREKQTVEERERCYREIEGKMSGVREADRERERERESIGRLTVRERERSYTKNYIKKIIMMCKIIMREKMMWRNFMKSN